MLLELQQLGKSFGEHEVLQDVNANVERGDRIGIIGANGTGKTTLLRILCGESLPDSGTASFGNGVTCGYLEQNANLALRRGQRVDAPVVKPQLATRLKRWRKCANHPREQR